MKAIIFDKPGEPRDVLSVHDVPKPEPKRGELLIRMLASPVNPSDLLYVQGRYGLKPTFPATPGFEGVGIVEQNGGGLLGRFRMGKRVALLSSARGTWAEYTIASAKQVFPVPAEIPDEQAAMFFVNPLTALALTRYVLNVPAGEWLLQTAAGSALGKMIIQLGKRHGFKTINIVRRKEQVEELKQLGADIVLCDADGLISDQVLAVTQGKGVRFALDPVGGKTGTQAVESLADGGTLVLYGLLSGEPVQVDPRWLITGSKRVQGFWLADWANQQGVLKKLRMMREVRSLLREGVFQSTIGGRYSLEQIGEAVAEADKPGKSGKVLLRIGTA